MRETNEVRQETAIDRPLDAIDRKLLSALAADAQRSFQDLGEIAGLSAPAVHERVKRLKAAGRIKATVALIDPIAAERPFLAFVHVDTTGWGKSAELMGISEFPEVEEIHSVCGDTCMLLKVRMKDSNAMESLLARIYAMPSVISTKSYVVLSSYLERPIQGGISHDFGTPGSMP